MKKSHKNNKRPASEEEFFFDDCPVCQAEKKALQEGRELSLTELRKAFRQAEKMQESD